MTPGSGGSWGAASAGSGLFDACTALREALARKLGVIAASAVYSEGRVSGVDASGASRSETLGSLAGTLGASDCRDAAGRHCGRAAGQGGAHRAKLETGAVGVEERPIMSVALAGTLKIWKLCGKLATL